MSWRTVAITSVPTRLSLRARQMAIAREGAPEATVPIEDLGLLIVDQPAVTYTHGLLIALAEGKIPAVLCGGDHMPAALVLPIAGNQLLVQRQRAQLETGRPLRKRLWQAVVRAKLRRQADLLRRATGDDRGLAAMAARVGSGDPANLEAQAAQRYWPALMGRSFRRDREADDANRLLNYGYAVLRACVARAVVGAGLLPSVGIFHAHRADAFALASDLMEPYRPFVDGVVWELVRGGLSDGKIDRVSKTHLLAVLNLGVALGGQAMPLSLAVERTATSLVRCFEEGKAQELLLPDGSAGLPADEESDAAGSPPPAA